MVYCVRLRVGLKNDGFGDLYRLNDELVIVSCWRSAHER